MKSYNYHTAFGRNIGWITPTEQELLRSKRIAVAGMGGVGGAHVLAHARFGIGAFNLADFDHFELHNFNRQVGATVETLGQSKVQVMAAMARAINPDVDLRTFDQGIDADCLDDFLSDVDLYVDSLDFFAVEARRQVFAACARKGIAAITAAPLGMSTAVLVFLPGGMTFEEYFRLDGHDELEQLTRFFVGLAPARLQMRYLVDPSTIDLAAHQGPSTIAGCELCAAVTVAQSIKILLQRGSVIAAPRGFQIDAYCNRMRFTYRPAGMRNPLLAVPLRLARPRLAAAANAVRAQPAAGERSLAGLDADLCETLDLARWAPSGDNTQPWRFEIVDARALVVHGRDTRDTVVYDYQGRASQMSMGALLESLTLAASLKGWRTEVTRRVDRPEQCPQFDVRFESDASVTVDPLVRMLKARCTQRRALSTQALDSATIDALERSTGDAFDIVWLHGADNRKRVAKVLFKNGRLRLTMPEAYPVHRDVIEWGAQYSEDRIPDRAVGLDPGAVKLMRWAIQSWARVRFLNTYLGGTLMPCLQLDYWPGLNCASHFVIVAKRAPTTIDDYVAAGRATQRFWLQATALGLQFQPEYTPLLFAKLARENVAFSAEPKSLEQCQVVATAMRALIGEQAIEAGVFMGRVGFGPSPPARSIRLPLHRLIADAPSENGVEFGDRTPG